VAGRSAECRRIAVFPRRRQRQQNAQNPNAHDEQGQQRYPQNRAFGRWEKNPAKALHLAVHPFLVAQYMRAIRTLSILFIIP
jgi:hypothetical protein